MGASYPSSTSETSEESDIASLSGQASFLPVYQIKEHRKRADYQLIIKSAIFYDWGKEFWHSWMELKNPKGEIHNFGLALPDHINITCATQGATFSAMLFTPDKYSSGSLTSTVRSLKVALSQKEYFDWMDEMEKLKQEGERVEKRLESGINQIGVPIVANSFNRNCTSIIRQAGERIGMHVPSRATYTELKLRVNIWEKVNALPSFFRIPITCVLYPIGYILAIIRNVIIYLLSNGKSIGGDVFDNKFHTFPTFGDVLDVERGMIDFPIKMMEWIDRVKQERTRRVAHIETEFTNSDEILIAKDLLSRMKPITSIKLAKMEHDKLSVFRDNLYDSLPYTPTIHTMDVEAFNSAKRRVAQKIYPLTVDLAEGIFL